MASYLTSWSDYLKVAAVKATYINNKKQIASYHTRGFSFSSIGYQMVSSLL